VRAAIHHILVEVDAEHEGQRDEGGPRQHPLPGDLPERGEERDVHEQVDLGVEIAPERARAARPARELTVRVVEQCLHLEQERAADQVASDHEIDGREPGDRVRDHDGRRRHA
jgi:hypothetical protein